MVSRRNRAAGERGVLRAGTATTQPPRRKSSVGSLQPPKAGRCTAVICPASLRFPATSLGFSENHRDRRPCAARPAGTGFPGWDPGLPQRLCPGAGSQGPAVCAADAVTRGSPV